MSNMWQTFRFCRHISACPFHTGSFPCTTTGPMCWTTGAILDIDDPVVRAPSAAQLDIHLALNIHEHEAASETDRNDDELRPERPFKHSSVNLFRRAVDKHVKWPDHTRDSDDVKCHWTEDLASLDLRHLQLLPLHCTTTVALWQRITLTISQFSFYFYYFLQTSSISVICMHSFLVIKTESINYLL